MADEPARKPKFSKDLLDLRHTEVTLAKQGMYADAHKVKVRADAMEAAEIERMQAEREQQAERGVLKFWTAPEVRQELWKSMNALTELDLREAEGNKKAKKRAVSAAKTFKDFA